MPSLMETQYLVHSLTCGSREPEKSKYPDGCQLQDSMLILYSHDSVSFFSSFVSEVFKLTWHTVEKYFKYLFNILKFYNRRVLSYLLRHIAR